MLQAYLVFYNFVCLLGWSYLLVLLASNGSAALSGTLAPVVLSPLKAVQSLAFLEVVHAALRMVRSPLVPCAMQVFSRLFLVWGVMVISSKCQQSLGFALTVASWTAVEIPRYLFYIVKSMQSPMPSWLLFLRYHLFYVLYPSGITGELWCIVSALPFILKSHIYSVALPNAWNFAFSYFLFVIVGVMFYLPAAPFMFNNMRRQREIYWCGHKKE